MHQRSESPLRRRAARTLLIAVAAGSAVACDNILSVETPGQVAAGDLDPPAVAALMVTSAISDFECAWNQYAAGVAVISDEYIATSGNAALRGWAMRDFETNDASFSQGGCGGAVYPSYTPLHTARFMADDVYRRLDSQEWANVADRTNRMATMRAYGGYALLALGEGYCEMTVPADPDTPGPLRTKGQMMELAESHFSEAITLATQANNADILNMARVGRPRARLNRGDFAGVITDAGAVPATYEKTASRDATAGRRFNYYFERNNAPTGFRQNAGIADHYRNLTIAADGTPTQGSGVADPRVDVFTTGGLGTDGVTTHWRSTKHPSQSAPVPIASGREARLLHAEALVRSDQPVPAVTLINERRLELGLPIVIYTGQDLMPLILEERRRELFLETGSRFNDMLRFRGTAYQIPFLGEPGSIHPNGVDAFNRAYGNVTCLPLPDVERAGNPNI
jgi:starch-binding outer membrane protein, SusD/RagB family